MGIELFIATVFVMLTSFAGKVFVWGSIGRWVEHNLNFLVSFSAGVFLSITFALIYEIYEHEGVFTEGGVIGALSVSAGALLFWLGFKLIPQFHHHHDAHLEGHLHSNIDARRILLSDAFHNAGDGILLAAAFATSGALGIVTATSVLFHELVQEISEFFVLRQTGLSTTRALLLNFFASSTILLGALIGFFLIARIEDIETPLLGLSAGAFLVVVFRDLIPHPFRVCETRLCHVHHLLWFALGAILMTTINLTLVHSHGNEESTYPMYTKTGY